MKPISRDTRLRAIKYLSGGLSNRKIAEIIGVNSKTVDKVAREVYPDRIKCKGGLPRKLTKREKQFCVRKITIGKQENAVSVQKCPKNELEVDVSAQTVRNYLKSAIGPRPMWIGRLMIGNESFGQMRTGSDEQRYTWKRESEPLQSRHVNQTVKHGGGNLKLRSCITYEGVGFLFELMKI